MGGTMLAQGIENASTGDGFFDPGKSRTEGAGMRFVEGLSLGRKYNRPKNATKPKGKLIKKIYLQLIFSIKKPPRSGPITGPESKPNVQADIALLLLFTLNISITNT